jgi:hypothetical protein
MPSPNGFGMRIRTIPSTSASAQTWCISAVAWPLRGLSEARLTTSRMPDPRMFLGKPRSDDDAARGLLVEARARLSLWHAHVAGMDARNWSSSCTRDLLLGVLAAASLSPLRSAMRSFCDLEFGLQAFHDRGSMRRLIASTLQARECCLRPAGTRCRASCHAFLAPSQA